MFVAFVMKMLLLLLGNMGDDSKGKDSSVDLCIFTTDNCEKEGCFPVLYWYPDMLWGQHDDENISGMVQCSSRISIRLIATRLSVNTQIMVDTFGKSRTIR
jgi:hypothetical protein